MLDVMVPYHTKPLPYDPFASYKSKHSKSSNDVKAVSFSPNKDTGSTQL